MPDAFLKSSPISLPENPARLTCPNLIFTCVAVGSATPANSLPLRRSTNLAESLPLALNLITADICTQPDTTTDWPTSGRTHLLSVSRSVVGVFPSLKLACPVTAPHKSVFNSYICRGAGIPRWPERELRVLEGICQKEQDWEEDGRRKFEYTRTQDIIGGGTRSSRWRQAIPKAKMEPLNVKLYEKYKNLKKRKFTEEEEWNHTRDAELRSFQSAVEDLIEELNKENKGLHQQLDSFQEKYDECRMLLLEEGKKSKELLDEVEKLQNLLLKKKDMNNALLFTSPSTSSKVRSEEISKIPPGQRITESCEENGTQHKVPTIVTFNNKKIGTSMKECYKRNFSSPGKQSDDCSNFIFQTLMRFLVGMDFHVDNQTESPSILVVHKTSGYSFSLTWMQHEGEWMYHVFSLGTLESIALDWMKEDIIFSAAMCRDFFERVSLIIGRM